MVLDAKLPEHLAHFGIDMMTMEKVWGVVPNRSTAHCGYAVICCKEIVTWSPGSHDHTLTLCSLGLGGSDSLSSLVQTERTMTELEIAVNQRVGEWEVIQESGATLRPLSGPGLTGMKNLGNSCYLNSVMQVLFTVPDFQRKSVPRQSQPPRTAPLWSEAASALPGELTLSL